MYTLESVSSVANFLTSYEESQENLDPHLLSVICSVFFKDRLLDFYSVVKPQYVPFRSGLLLLFHLCSSHCNWP